MVLDIEKYPEFVPWCINGKIYTKEDKGNKIEIIADLTIGKSFFNETYKSLVIYDKSSDVNKERPIGSLGRIALPLATIVFIPALGANSTK